MSKSLFLFLSLMFMSVNLHAVEPVLDQQGMLYFNVSFDAGQTSKTEHDFGFRFDRALVRSGENMTLNHLAATPAVFNLKLNKDGLKALELHGIDYAEEYLAYRAAEGEEGEKKESVIKKIPLGVFIGVAIGVIAFTGSNR